MTETFHLKGTVLQFIIIFVFRNFQLGFAFNTHLVFFFVQSETFGQAVHFILRLQSLLFQREAFLLHLNFLLFISDSLFLPFIALVFDRAQQIGIAEHKDGISFLHHGSFFADDAFHAAGFAGIYLDGQDRLD